MPSAVPAVDLPIPHLDRPWLGGSRGGPREHGHHLAAAAHGAIDISPVNVRMQQWPEGIPPPCDDGRMCLLGEISHGNILQPESLARCQGRRQRWLRRRRVSDMHGVGRTGLDGRPVPVEQDVTAGPALLLLIEPFRAQN